MIKRTLVALALGTALLGSVATVTHASGPLKGQPSAVPAERSNPIAPVAAQSSEDTRRATPRHDDAVARSTSVQAAGGEDAARRSTGADDHAAQGRAVARAPLAEPGDR